MQDDVDEMSSIFGLGYAARQTSDAQSNRDTISEQANNQQILKEKTKKPLKKRIKTEDAQDEASQKDSLLSEITVK